jgi:hypothetical protein
MPHKISQQSFLFKGFLMKTSFSLFFNVFMSTTCVYSVALCIPYLMSHSGLESFGHPPAAPPEDRSRVNAASTLKTLKKLAADLKNGNAASSLKTFFSKSTSPIFDTKICLESAWQWLSILLKVLFFKLPF